MCGWAIGDWTPARHASAAETLDTYSHHWPDSENLTRSSVVTVLGAAVKDEGRLAT